MTLSDKIERLLVRMRQQSDGRRLGDLASELAQTVQRSSLDERQSVAPAIAEEIATFIANRDAGIWTIVALGDLGPVAIGTRDDLEIERQRVASQEEAQPMHFGVPLSSVLERAIAKIDGREPLTYR